MEKKVFSLDGVPQKEAEDIRRLLLKRGIRVHELPEGHFLGGGGLWVRSEGDFVKARRHIEAYQALLRQEQRRKSFEIAEGPWYESIARRLRDRPHLALLLIAVLLILISGMLSY